MDRVLLEKVIKSNSVQKFLAFCEKLKSNTAFKRAFIATYKKAGITILYFQKLFL